VSTARLVIYSANKKAVEHRFVNGNLLPLQATVYLRSRHSRYTREGPLWVISGHLQRKMACPLYPRKRTCAVHSFMSAMGQKQTHAPQHNWHKKKDRQRAGPSKIRSGFFQVASAAAFLFLRQPSRPNAPRPEAKSGRAAGRGVADKEYVHRPTP
jgi:hypothetical protein